MRTALRYDITVAVLFGRFLFQSVYDCDFNEAFDVDNGN